MSEPKLLTPKVAIIGAGPAGLSAAKKLAGRSGGEVLVGDREKEAGGIPRHADHLGYGIRDRKRFMSGPAYARALVAEARNAGATIMTRTMVTGWADDKTLVATTPHGRVLIRPEVFCFATGARERPRTARMIPGTRPDGILTTGQLQNRVHLNHDAVGTKAVVVGAELVSWSAVMTLAESGYRTIALVSEYDKPESYGLFTGPGQLWFRTRVTRNAKVVQIHGKDRVSGVEIEHTTSGRRKIIECDTVVFTGSWIPDNELLRMAGVTLDPASRSPVVNAVGATSKPGIFAVGNLNHPVETADVVALEGENVADRILEHLRGTSSPMEAVAITVDDPIAWISPSTYTPRGPRPARGRFVAWVDRLITRPIVTVRQGGRVVASKRLWWPAAPGRAFRIPSSLLQNVDPAGGDVRLRIG